MNDLFFNNIEKNDINQEIIKKIEEYAKDNSREQIYLISAPLGGKQYTYDYEKNAVVILSPKHKIIFLYLNNDKESSKKYYRRFISDLSSISDKFDYKDFIGYSDEWEDELIITETIGSNFDIKNFLENNRIENNLERKNELIISLLIGSINDIEKIGLDKPESLLEKVKNNIILFDGDQTRFIYKKLEQKKVSIQGLSGTGKTELLLHKLKEIYLSEEKSKTFFTCHNIALANTLKSRIPNFFNFMKVEKQIQWNEQLWVDRAWGSGRDKNSGLYSYICDFYNIQFLRWNKSTTYEIIFKLALEEIKKIDNDNFEYAFDYILIDERQDFPDIFFELCEKITRKKVYIAGDIFQDIFDNNIEQRIIDVDYVLNRCYRTDPRVLMFAHSIGMGLFENKKLNWLKDKEWKACGYKIDKDGRNVCLSRESVRRFEDLAIDDISTMNIEKYDNINKIIDIIENIIKENPTVRPEDIAIIVLDDDKTIYEFMYELKYEIMNRLECKVNIAYESKRKIENAIFLSNKNNAKGLEFPFVICITNRIQNNYSYRNTLYTMLTRSFIQSFLLVKNDENIEIQKEGLKIIQNQNYIKTIEPTNEEQDDIKNTIIRVEEEKNISFNDFLSPIFDSFKLDSKCRKKLTKKIIDDIEDKFNKEKVRAYIEFNKNYC